MLAQLRRQQWCANVRVCIALQEIETYNLFLRSTDRSFGFQNIWTLRQFSKKRGTLPYKIFPGLYSTGAIQNFSMFQLESQANMPIVAKIGKVGRFALLSKNQPLNDLTVLIHNSMLLHHFSKGGRKPFIVDIQKASDCKHEDPLPLRNPEICIGGHQFFVALNQPQLHQLLVSEFYPHYPPFSSEALSRIEHALQCLGDNRD